MNEMKIARKGKKNCGIDRTNKEHVVNYSKKTVHFYFTSTLSGIEYIQRMKGFLFYDKK